MTLIRRRPSSGGSGGPSGLLTPRAASTNTTAADGELVEMDASTAVRVVTGPTAGTSLHWGAKKVDGAPDDPGNSVTVTYINSTGGTTNLDLGLTGDTAIFYASGAGYSIESGYTPPDVLLASASATALTIAAAVRSTQWFGSTPSTPRPLTSDPVLWVGLSGTVPTNAIDDYDVIAVLTAP